MEKKMDVLDLLIAVLRAHEKTLSRQIDRLLVNGNSNPGRSTNLLVKLYICRKCHMKNTVDELVERHE